MRINNKVSSISEYNKIKATTKKDVNKTEEIRKPDGKVEISDTGKILSKKINKYEEESISAKVREIKSKIDRNEYRVSSEEIARGMVTKIKEQKASE